MLVLGALVLLSGLGDHALGVDEAVYIDAATAVREGGPRLNPEHPPLAKQLAAAGQAVFGEDRLGARLPGAVLALVTTAAAATAAALVVHRRRVLAAACAAAVFVLLPLAPGAMTVRVERYVMLEPVASAALAVVLALSVLALRDRDAAPLVAAAAVAGLAVASKATGVVAVVAPLAALLLPGWGRWRRVGLGLAVVSLALLVAAVPFALPGGGGGDGLEQAVGAALARSDDTQTQVVAGQVRTAPPWWSHWAFQADYLGVPATVALWASAAAGLVVALRRRAAGLPVVVVLAAVLVVLVVPPLRLPHYHVLWSVPLAVLAGVGLTALLGASRVRGRFPAGQALAAVVVAVLGVAALGNVVAALGTGPTNYARLPAVLADVDADVPVVAVEGYALLVQRELDDVVVTSTAEATAASALPDVVVIDPVVAERRRSDEAREVRADLLTRCGGAGVAVDRLQVYVCG